MEKWVDHNQSVIAPFANKALADLTDLTDETHNRRMIGRNSLGETGGPTGIEQPAEVSPGIDFNFRGVGGIPLHEIVKRIYFFTLFHDTVGNLIKHHACNPLPPGKEVSIIGDDYPS